MRVCGQARSRSAPSLAITRGRGSSSPARPVLRAAATAGRPSLALEQLALGWEGDEDDDTEAVAFAVKRCDPGARESARQIEQQIVAAVDARVADTGWSLALTGAYPRTLIMRRHPDGAVDESVEPEVLRDRWAPGGSEVDAVVTPLRVGDSVVVLELTTPAPAAEQGQAVCARPARWEAWPTASDQRAPPSRLRLAGFDPTVVWIAAQPWAPVLPTC